MSKAFILLSLLGCSCLQASTWQEALAARDKAMTGLHVFTPSKQLPGYSDHPKEITLAPDETQNQLLQQGLEKLQDEYTAASVFHQAQNRAHIRHNPKTIEGRYAEDLLNKAEQTLDGQCYEVHRACKPQITTRGCEEILTYQPQTCGEKLNVQVEPQTQTVERLFITAGFAMPVTFSLSNCGTLTYCNPIQLITLDKACQQLTIIAYQDGKRLSLLKAPNCHDPSVSLQLNATATPGGVQGVKISLTITQQLLRETWQHENCQGYERSCYPEATNICAHPNETRMIDGIAILRPCWERQTRYQCMSDVRTTCLPWFEQGCSQIASKCIEANNSRCTHYQQTLNCPSEQCLPAQKICLDKPACSQGDCDNSQDEKNHDIQDGLSRLAALTGSAEEFTRQSVQNVAEPSLFAGKAISCQKYILGLRDCCEDEGWGDWVVHCPKPLQDLLKAKHEKRVAYLGAYKDDLLSKTHVYCLFPSKLAGIIQIQGRAHQLGHAFGQPKQPDCGSLSVKELEALDFSKLDLSSLMEDLSANIHIPDAATLLAKQQAQIERLQAQGKAHE